MVAWGGVRAGPWDRRAGSGVELLPGLHPRMASEQRGPEARNLLEPPGFLALHYGVQTPLTILLSHMVFGLIWEHFIG